LTETREFELSADSMDAYVSLFGLNDQNIAMVEQECHVRFSLHDHHLIISGEPEQIQFAQQTVEVLLDLISREEAIDRMRIRYIISMSICPQVLHLIWYMMQVQTETLIEAL
jgi:phosphate starvation-inducible PhoH-like protein